MEARYLEDQSNTQVWQKSNNNDYITSNAYATYEKAFGAHSFKVMAGAQQEYKNAFYLTASKKFLILPDVASISTATGTLDC